MFKNYQVVNIYNKTRKTRNPMDPMHDYKTNVNDEQGKAYCVVFDSSLLDFTRPLPSFFKVQVF